MSTNFYDKVAKKFGGYAFGTGHVEYHTEYPHGDPEKVFKEKLLGLSGAGIKVLDVGCGDGKFAFGIATYFLSITGIDTSKELLIVAGQKQKIFPSKNLFFEFQNAHKTTFPDSSFDVVFSRRGPTAYVEFQRVLKPEGSFVGIDIGEKDCQSIKEVFERGQGYKTWNTSRLEKERHELRRAGFEIVFGQEYFYNEYYASYKDLDTFLQSVPIFEDFDSEKDKQLLEEYVKKFTTEKGIQLPRHRVVLVAKKR